MLNILPSASPFLLNFAIGLMFVVGLQSQLGEIVCFDNWRVLHGRKSFDASRGTVRKLEHCYIEWDEVHARRRHLQQQLLSTATSRRN